MDTTQRKLILHVKMLVNCDFSMIFGRQKRKKTFPIKWGIICLRDMKTIKSFLEKQTYNLIFFHKERGLSHDDQFHAFTLFCIAKVEIISHNCKFFLIFAA